MSKLTWISSLIVLAVGAGGTAYYYVKHQNSEAPEAVAPVAPESPAVQPSTPKRDDEMQRRKLEGIGSTRDLKPVPIPKGDAR